MSVFHPRIVEINVPFASNISSAFSTPFDRVAETLTITRLRSALVATSSGTIDATPGISTVWQSLPSSAHTVVVVASETATVGGTAGGAGSGGSAVTGDTDH